MASSDAVVPFDTDHAFEVNAISEAATVSHPRPNSPPPFYYYYYYFDEKFDLHGGIRPSSLLR